MQLKNLFKKKKKATRVDVDEKKEPLTPEEIVATAKIPPGISGLTSGEVASRISAGASNKKPEDLTRTTKQIIQENCFTLFNFVNVMLAIAVILVGSPKNAFFLVVIGINTLIGIFQEVRAKKTIDRLALMNETQVTAVRDGRLELIHHDDIVLDDVLLVVTGSQIPSDGLVLLGEGLEIDESLLTGEADNIQKSRGAEVMSGSFVTAGRGFIQITQVGEDNYISKLSKEAKSEIRPTSDLMNALNRMIRVLTFTIVPVGILLFWSQYQTTSSIKSSVLAVSAALVSMIPEGLMLLTSVAFAVGAANLARKKTLVQTLPCIETLARVDTICLDKTGTITDGSLVFQELSLTGEASKETCSQILSELMRALPDENATANVVRNAFPSNGNSWSVDTISPFSSARKWSGVSFTGQGSFLMGAPEFIFSSIPSQWQDRLTDYSEQGFRVLVLAKSDAPLTAGVLPEAPDALALLIIADNIRENAQETFSFFAKEGVTLKVISGDNPLTVSKIAKRAGISGAEHYIDMTTVQSGETDFRQLVEETTVFGRVTPYQKRELVQALKANGHVTCMTGDGVNDILSLKEADVGVAMASGSDAARSVSDVVLLDSDFSRMVDVLKEGRRVINNIERVAAMYLVKTIYSVILAVAFIFLPLTYPFAPLQMTPINSLTVGIPSFILALRPSYERIKGRFLTNILRISVPGALTVVLNIAILQGAGICFDLSWESLSTMCVLLTGMVGFQVLTRVARPLDIKKKIMITLLLVCFLGAFLFLGDFFGYETLFNRNVFFYLPLILGSRSIFNYISLVMEWLVYQLGKHRFIKEEIR